MVMMDAQEYKQLLENFDPSSEEQRKSLEKITYRYPYFQSAYAHYLKTLKVQDEYNYGLILQKTAVLTPSREALYHWIEAEEHRPVKSTKQKESVAKNQGAVEEVLSIEPIKRLTFGEWIVQAGNEIEEIQESKGFEAKLDLIDTFLKNQPKIPPVPKDQKIIDLTKDNAFNTEELMTETLAKVYVEQKKYKKAFLAYKILSLKYPEKNSFFADQIKQIKKLQKHK